MKSHHILCFFCYSLSLAAAAVSLSATDVFGLHLWVDIVIAHVVSTLVIFLFSTFYSNSSLYDPYWSVAPVPIYFFVALSDENGINLERIFLVGIPVCYWAFRLTHNWLRTWPGLSKEDFRYVNLYETFGSFKWFINLFGIHLFPTLIVNLCLFPLYFYFIENSADVSSLDYLICLFTLSMVLLEQISDEQMHIFKANIENKGKTMNEGLWKYSRHPNYLGEVGFWFGLCAFGLIGSNGSILLLICPIAMLLMFMFASIPMMDNRSLENRPDYADYMKKTSSLMLFPSKK